MSINYKSMWGKLKEKVESNIKYYKDGSMCSIHEAVVGESQWKEVKAYMERLEQEENNANQD